MTIANQRVRVTVNGVTYERSVEPRLLLSDFLRHELGLTGTHVGCEHGVCGMCTILLDDRTARSCLAFAVQADGCQIRGSGHSRWASRDSGGLLGEARPPVRLLHAGHVDDDRRADRRQPQSLARRDSRGCRRQSLPLHRLPDHRRSGRACRPASRRRKGADP